MRRKFRALPVIIFFLLLIKTVSAGAGTLTASTAHIYRNQAILIIPLVSSDTAEILLPPAIDENSIRLATTGDKEIINYSIEKIPASSWYPPALSGLTKRIEQDKKTVSAVKLHIKSIEMAIIQLGDIKPEISPEEVPKYVNTILTSKKELNTRLLEEENKVNVLRAKIKDDESLLKTQTAGTAGKVLKLSVKDRGTGNLYLICRTKYAGWSRSYRLNLNSTDKKLIATLEGKIYQKSGIDLDGEIILHQGNPENRLYTPNVKAITVGTQKQVERKKSYSMETAMVMREMAEPLLVQKKQIKESLTDKTIRFSGMIKGNGIKKSVNLERWSDTVDTSLLVIPYLSKKAWLMVNIEKIDFPTVNAPAEIYVDGNYSGKNSMKKRVRGQELNMAFAFIPEIGIKREKIIPENKSSWTGKGTLKEGYSITLTNGLRKTVDLTVKDRIPVTVEGEISVKKIEINPSYSSLDDEKGILSWNISLNPGEQRRIKVIYEIKYPSDTELSFSENR